MGAHDLEMVSRIGRHQSDTVEFDRYRSSPQHYNSDTTLYHLYRQVSLSIGHSQFVSTYISLYWHVSAWINNVKGYVCLNIKIAKYCIYKLSYIHFYFFSSILVFCWIFSIWQKQFERYHDILWWIILSSVTDTVTAASDCDVSFSRLSETTIDTATTNIETLDNNTRGVLCTNICMRVYIYTLNRMLHLTRMLHVFSYVQHC